MARDEADREDLIREAVALTERAEFRIDGSAELVTIGFRTTKAMSVFIGQDPVYHFDPEGRLRRAFVDGFLFRSQHTTLARMVRERTETQTLLLRTDLTESELGDFRSRMLSALQNLQQSIKDGSAVISRSVPADVDLIPQVLSGLHLALSASTWLSGGIRRRR
jgi:hypothetical protein